MADVPSDGDSDSDDAKLDPVLQDQGSAVSEDDDQVVGSMERKPLTKLPSVEQEERSARALAASSSAPQVVQSQIQQFVDDEALKEIQLCIREPGKKNSYIIPKERILHAAFKDRAGQDLEYLTVKAAALVDANVHRTTMTRTLIEEHGATAVAERCIFVSCELKPRGIFAIIPVNLSHTEGHEEMVAELTSENRVACWLMQTPEVEKFMRPASAANSSIPKTFGKNAGHYELVGPNISKEATSAANWTKISPDTNNKKRSSSAGSSKRKEPEVAEPASKRRQAGASDSTESASTVMTVVESPEIPSAGSWWMETGEEAEEASVSQKVVKNFVNPTDETLVKWFGVKIPPGGSLSVSTEVTFSTV